MIVALQGELTTIKQQMEKTYELLALAGSAASFVADKLQQLEKRRLEAETKLRKKEQERSQSGSLSTRFYETREQIKALIEQLQSRGGDEIYKLRSQIANRLRSLVTTVLVAPLGHAPLVQRTIEFLSGEAESEAVIAELNQNLGGATEHRRYFAVGFPDGTVRGVYPHQDDPLQFEHQILGTREGLLRLQPETNFR
jgi:alanyl-tRNA synthetase